MRSARGRLPRRRPVDAGLRLLHAPGRRRLDEGPGGRRLRLADAPARLRLLRHPRAVTAARWLLPRAGHPRSRGLPRRTRAAAVLVPEWRVRRDGLLRGEGVRRARYCSGSRASAVTTAWTHSPTDHRRGRLAGGQSPTASCSRTSATAPVWCGRSRSSSRSRSMVDEHLRHAARYQEGAPGPSPWSARAASGWSCSRTTSRRFGSSPSNASIAHWSDFPAVGTMRPSKCLRTSSPT